MDATGIKLGPLSISWHDQQTVRAISLATSWDFGHQSPLAHPYSPQG